MIRMMLVSLCVVLLLFTGTFGPLYLAYLILVCTAGILCLYKPKSIAVSALFLVSLPIIAAVMVASSISSR